MIETSRIYKLQTSASRSNIHVELKKPKGIGYIRLFFKTASVLAPKWTIKRALELFITPRKRAKHAISDELLESAVKHTMDFEGNKVRVYEWKGGNKKAVLLHGWESRATALRVVVPMLITKGYSVYGIDAIAHGESSGKMTNAKEYAEIIYTASNIYGPFDLAITHSFGGLALGYAIVNMKDFNIPKVVMLGQPATTELALKGMFSLLKLNNRIQNGVKELIHKMSGYKVEDFSVAKFAKEFTETKGLLFHDDKDNLVPLSIALDVVDNWQDSILYETTGLGHYRLIKSKEVLEKINDWV